MGRVLLDGDFRHRLESTELKCHGMLRDDVSRLAKLHRSLELSLSGDDLRTAFALGLGFLSHCALHVIGKHYVFDLNRRHLPQGSVCPSMTFLICSLMLAVSERS